jgi:hypothetical protein
MTPVSGLLEALGRQREAYRRMAEAAREQRRLLAAGDVDALLALVERKRALLADAQAAARQTAPVRESWERIRPGLDAAAVRQVEQAVDETRRLLEALVRLEDEALRG